nr:hypothetical protein [uncultured Caldimonas sp.]
MADEMDDVSQVNSDLLMLTYAPQFDHPMTTGIRNVVNKLVEPKYPLQQEDYYLAIIQRLLNSNAPLSGAAPSVTGRNEDEIREFLFEFAKALENEYRFSRRGGKVASCSGRWVCVSLGAEGEFLVGEVLPVLIDGSEVWVHQPAADEKSAWGILKEELLRYYRPKFLRAAVGGKKSVQPYAEASYLRMKELLQREHLESLKKDLARLLANDSSKWEELNSAVGDALSSPDVRDWLMKFFSEFAVKIS